MNTSRTCGMNGHNSRTCSEAPGGESGIMLFGVRLTGAGGLFRKSVSLNNLNQYEQPPRDSSNADAGYASDDVVHPSGRCRERKRGIPWTEEEHRQFLVGLEKVGKGDWRGIARNFVKTRTPTQVASHAQKYFLRRNGVSRRRRRSSLFDITADTEAMPPPLPPAQPQKDCNPINFPARNPSATEPSVAGGNTTETTLALHSNSYSKIIRPKPILPLPPHSKLAHQKIRETPPENPSPLALKLSMPHSDEQLPAASAFPALAMSGAENIDVVTVA